jgi:predicted transcriptional regulator
VIDASEEEAKGQKNSAQIYNVTGKGKLLIKIQKAEKLRDANNISLMNPQCIFDLLELSRE